MKSSVNPKQSSNLPLKAVGKAALLFAKVGANTKCAYIFHDPEKPAELKKLRKF